MLFTTTTPSAGKDATQDFEEIGHSISARDMLDKYKIGAYAVRSAGARHGGGGWMDGGCCHAAARHSHTLRRPAGVRATAARRLRDGWLVLFFDESPLARAR